MNGTGARHTSARPFSNPFAARSACPVAAPSAHERDVRTTVLSSTDAVLLRNHAPDASRPGQSKGGGFAYLQVHGRGWWLMVLTAWLLWSVLLSAFTSRQDARETALTFTRPTIVATPLEQ